MKKRIIAACVFVPVMILLLSFAPLWAAMLLLAFLCAVGARELMHAVASEEGKGKLTPVTMGAAGLLSVCIFAENELHQKGIFANLLPLEAVLALVFVFLLFFFTILNYGTDSAVSFSDVTAAIFAGVVFPLMLSCLLRLRMMPGGRLLVWLPLAISFGSDTCALFAGMAFGKRKMAPRVSPHKTIGGGIGGVAGGVIGLLILKLAAHLLHTPMPLSIGKIVLFGVICSVVSEIGDLSFSVIKREYGVKDYGKLIPGHGGVLDRFDSVTFVTPMIYLLLRIL
jgi:phosphatidate cytidylyltransferase